MLLLVEVVDGLMEVKSRLSDHKVLECFYTLITLCSFSIKVVSFICVVSEPGVTQCHMVGYRD